MITIIEFMFEPYAPPKGRSLHASRGVTIIELLIAVMISSIAFMGLAVPLIAERVQTISGRRQAEAQRDAQVAMRAIARAARECKFYVINAAADQVTFSGPAVAPCTPFFRGGPNFAGQFVMSDGCPAPQTTALIDGIRSQVVHLRFEPVVANRLVRAHIEVTREGQESEHLETEIFLRNG